MAHRDGEATGAGGSRHRPRVARWITGPITRLVSATGAAAARRAGALLSAGLAAIISGTGLALAPSSAPAAVDGIDVRALETRFGALARDRGVRLQGLLDRVRGADVETRLSAVNRFFNAFTYRTDRDLWGRDDHWATPFEFIGRHGGDCEDFVISKYFALRAVGIPESRLSLVYVIVKKPRTAHMVLGYRAVPGGPVVYLDNNHPEVLPAAKRPDLVPVFSIDAAASSVAARPAEGSRSPGLLVGSTRFAELLGALGAGWASATAPGRGLAAALPGFETAYGTAPND